MIVYLATHGHRYTARMYLRSWGRPLRGMIVPLRYDDVLACGSLRAATYVFSDLERLVPEDAARAAELWESLALHGLRLLNHPTRSLGRYALLRLLSERGTNRFEVCRAGETPRRFPVFVRGERDHDGSRTPLLATPAALAEALAALELRGMAREDLLVSEFCDTADACGIYRKYSAFVIGDRIVPRHVFFSRHWMLKAPDLVDAEMAAEERAYVETNPHERELRTIFRLARIEWGRIDYALLDGALQVWEINTNPQLLSFEDGGGPRRLPAHAHVAVALRTAWAAVDHAASPRRLPVPHVRRVPAARRASTQGLGRTLLRRSGLLWHEERIRGWLRLVKGLRRRPVPRAT